MSQVSHTKVSTTICDIRKCDATQSYDKINFTDKGGGVFESDPIDLCAASAISIHAKFATNIDVTLLDKDASDYLGEDVVIITSGSATTVNINKPLLRQMAIHKGVIRVSGVTNFSGLKLMSKVMYEFGASRP